MRGFVISGDGGDSKASAAPRRRRMPLHPEFLTRPVMVSFRARIHFQDHCWIWGLTTNRNAPGRFVVAGRVHSAHRVRWIDFFGEVPDDTVVHHVCGDRRCVNPGHLRAISYRESVRQGAVTKLDRAKVSVIRGLHCEGFSMKELAALLKCTPQNIRAIIDGKTWIY